MFQEPMYYVARCWGFVVWVWVSASQKIPLSVLARNPHKGFACEISHETGRGRGPRLNRRKLNRIGQSAGESSRQKSGEADGQRKSTARTCGSRGRVGQREKMSLRSWWLCGNFARIHARDSSLMHRKLHKSVTNFSLLALGANPSPCLVVLFSSTLSVVYVVFCVSVKKCKIPLAGDERNH